MVKEYLSFDDGLVVADVLQDLAQNGEDYVDFNVQYSYVIDDVGRLTGVLRLRDLVLARRQTPIVSVMIQQPVSVRTDAGLSELRDFFEDHQFVGLPVVDSGGLLVGVILRDAVRQAEGRVADEQHLESTGIVGGEELRSMGVPATPEVPALYGSTANVTSMLCPSGASSSGAQFVNCTIEAPPTGTVRYCLPPAI